MDEVKEVKSPSDNFIENLLFIESDLHLEKKAWFRLLRILQGIAITLIIGIGGLAAYMMISSTTLDTATLVCKDGTTWNAIDKNYSFKTVMDSEDLCGMCTKRDESTKLYTKCSISEISARDSSYDVKTTSKMVFSWQSIIVWPTLGVVIGLVLQKLLMRGIMYVAVGNKKE